jgi:hypothetical protein
MALMRIGWHSSWLLGAALCACSLNPQPELPDAPGRPGESGDAGPNASGGAAASGGASGSSAVITEPSGGGLDIGGDAGANSAEAGAGGEAGAAQLAPGPAR